jgi:sugar (pentulose or hexulose) kinase
MRSVFEGLAYSFYDCISVFDSIYNTIYFSGGASKSDMVCQMFCDVIGKPAQRIRTKEAGVLGIIRILQVALGYVENFNSFTQQPTSGFKPDMNKHVEYMKGFQLYKELRDMMESFWDKRYEVVNTSSNRVEG